MTAEKKNRVRTSLFVAGGMLLGIAWYWFAGCESGSCAITANPFVSAGYMGIVGWLLSQVFRRECDSGCST